MLGKSDVSTHLVNVERVWGPKEKDMHRSIVTVRVVIDYMYNFVVYKYSRNANNIHLEFRHT